MTRSMPGVSIRAWRGTEFVPLIELLLVVGRWIVSSHWRVRNAEFATGWRGSDELNTMSSHASLTPTSVFVDLIADGVQMIDGEVQAYSKAHEEQPFLIIRSVRGDEWDLRSDEPAILEEVRKAYEATELPQ